MTNNIHDKAERLATNLGIDLKIIYFIAREMNNPSMAYSAPFGYAEAGDVIKKAALS